VFYASRHNNKEPEMINPRTGNTFRFDWMKAEQWTCKEIKATFNVPRAIGYHIQEVAQTEAQAWEIAKAHKELTQQIGF
jgi:hypothetical protein